jgi:hypothetical protein
MTPRIQVTTIFQRKDETVEFHRIPRDMLTYVEEGYIVPGKMISRDSYQSSDKLSKTLISHFASDEDRKDYLQDPKIKELLKTRNDHCKTNGIRITVLTQAYDDNGIISSNTDVISPL